jgi:hypothetical protein
LTGSRPRSKKSSDPAGAMARMAGKATGFFCFFSFRDN